MKRLLVTKQGVLPPNRQSIASDQGHKDAVEGIAAAGAAAAGVAAAGVAAAGGGCGE